MSECEREKEREREKTIRKNYYSHFFINECSAGLEL